MALWGTKGRLTALVQSMRMSRVILSQYFFFLLLDVLAAVCQTCNYTKLVALCPLTHKKTVFIFNLQIFKREKKKKIPQSSLFFLSPAV